MESDPVSRAVVVLPLREGTAARARELAGGGPPFDPAELSLTGYELFLTESEAVFVFEAPSGTVLESLLDRLDVWRDVAAGPPRLAEPACSWHHHAVGSTPVGLGF